MQALSLRNISQSHRDAICKLHQVPNNLNQVKKMCELLKDLLKEKNENNSLAIDEIQDRVPEVHDGSFIQSVVKVGHCQEVILLLYL